MFWFPGRKTIRQALTTTPTTNRLEYCHSRSHWVSPVLYLGWADLFRAPLFGSRTSVWEGTNLVLFLVGGASPLLAGLTRHRGGRDHTSQTQ